MNSNLIDVTDLHTYSSDQLRLLLANTGISLCVRINPAISQVDAPDSAEFFAEALFVGESIAPHCQSIAFDQGGNYVVYTFFPQDVDAIVQVLSDIAPCFYQEDSDDDLNYLEARGVIADFIDTLHERTLYFPSLADDYMINLVNCGFEDHCDYLSKYPERQHGFFKSFLSKSFGYSFYVSSDVFLLPTGVDVALFLQQYGACDDGIVLEKARLRGVFGGRITAYTQTREVQYPEHMLHDAQECAFKVYLGSMSQKQPLHSEGCLSSDGRFLILRDEIAQYACLTPPIGDPID